MDLVIPEKLSDKRQRIEKQYEADEIFKDIYDDYLTYHKALKLWEQSNTDDAPARRREYAELVGELEDELLQYLIEKERDS